VSAAFLVDCKRQGCSFFTCTFYSRVADPRLFISYPDLDPDPSWRVILDPDPAPGSFWIRILACEIFVKFLHLMSECTMKGNFCPQIELFMFKILFLSLHLSFKRPDPNDNFGSGSYLSAYFGLGSGSWKVKVSDPYCSGSGSATLFYSTMIIDKYSGTSKGHVIETLFLRLHVKLFRHTAAF